MLISCIYLLSTRPQLDRTDEPRETHIIQYTGEVDTSNPESSKPIGFRPMVFSLWLGFDWIALIPPS
jgi:hypothetical protein